MSNKENKYIFSGVCLNVTEKGEQIAADKRSFVAVKMQLNMNNVM